MAMMQDVKPTEYKGEAFVWEKLSDYLPSDVIVYNHREIIDGREFDFALLIKGLGILVIEVKGWQAKYIFDVKSPDEIIMQDEPKPIKSPEKQARGYRFDWLNFVQDQFGLSPVVLSAVCYPFISRQEYKKCRLDIVSSEEFRRHTRSLCDWSSDVCSSDLRWMMLRFRPFGSISSHPLRFKTQMLPLLWINILY